LDLNTHPSIKKEINKKRNWLEMENGSKELLIRLDERVKNLTDQFLRILEGYKNIPKTCRQNREDCKSNLNMRLDSLAHDIQNLDDKINREISKEQDSILMKAIIELSRAVVILVAAREVAPGIS
jgi:molecular chaperone GrpE (heat shock protein)